VDFEDCRGWRWVEKLHFRGLLGLTWNFKLSSRFSVLQKMYRGPLIHINRSLYRTQKAALLIRLLLICCKKVFGEIKVSGAFQRVIEGNFP